MRPIGGPPRLSFVSGTSDRPLLYRTVDGVLKAAAEEGPDRDALVAPFQSLRLTFAELDREVERVARGMLACGLEPGERIGIWAPNCAEWVLTMFAAARAGLVLVNVNPAYRSTELEFALRLVGCRALGVRAALQDQRLRRHAQCPDPGAAHGRARPAAVRGLPGASAAGATGQGTFERHSVLRRSARRRAGRRRGDGGFGREAVERGLAGCGSDFQHPVHERHDGHAEGRDADALQHREQRFLRRRGHAARRR